MQEKGKSRDKAGQIRNDDELVIPIFIVMIITLLKTYHNRYDQVKIQLLPSLFRARVITVLTISTSNALS